MKYFIDCEFLEYEKQPKLFGLIPVGKPVKTTELISIALVTEEGLEYYAEVDSFNWKEAMKHSFLPQHVLPHLGGFDIDGGIRPGFKEIGRAHV